MLIEFGTKNNGTSALEFRFLKFEDVRGIDSDTNGMAVIYLTQDSVPFGRPGMVNTYETTDTVKARLLGADPTKLATPASPTDKTSAQANYTAVQTGTPVDPSGS
jgi:hypothetical protein